MHLVTSPSAFLRRINSSSNCDQAFFWRGVAMGNGALTLASMAVSSLVFLIALLTAGLLLVGPTVPDLHSETLIAFSWHTSCFSSFAVAAEAVSVAADTPETIACGAGQTMTLTGGHLITAESWGTSAGCIIREDPTVASTTSSRFIRFSVGVEDGSLGTRNLVFRGTSFINVRVEINTEYAFSYEKLGPPPYKNEPFRFTMEGCTFTFSDKTAWGTVLGFNGYYLPHHSTLRLSDNVFDGRATSILRTSTSGMFSFADFMFREWGDNTSLIAVGNRFLAKDVIVLSSASYFSAFSFGTYAVSSWPADAQRPIPEAIARISNNSKLVFLRNTFLAEDVKIGSVYHRGASVQALFIFLYNTLSLGGGSSFKLFSDSEIPTVLSSSPSSGAEVGSEFSPFRFNSNVYPFGGGDYDESGACFLVSSNIVNINGTSGTELRLYTPLVFSQSVRLFYHINYSTAIGGSSPANYSWGGDVLSSPSASSGGQQQGRGRCRYLVGENATMGFFNNSVTAGNSARHGIFFNNFGVSFIALTSGASGGGAGRVGSSSSTSGTTDFRTFHSQAAVVIEGCTTIANNGEIGNDNSTFIGVFIGDSSIDSAFTGRGAYDTTFSGVVEFPMISKGGDVGSGADDGALAARSTGGFPTFILRRNSVTANLPRYATVADELANYYDSQVTIFILMESTSPSWFSCGFVGHFTDNVVQTFGGLPTSTPSMSMRSIFASFASITVSTKSKLLFEGNVITASQQRLSTTDSEGTSIYAQTLWMLSGSSLNIFSRNGTMAGFNGYSPLVVGGFDAMTGRGGEGPFTDIKGQPLGERVVGRDSSGDSWGGADLMTPSPRLRSDRFSNTAAYSSYVDDTFYYSMGGVGGPASGGSRLLSLLYRNDASGGGGGGVRPSRTALAAGDALTGIYFYNESVSTNFVGIGIALSSIATLAGTAKCENGQIIFINCSTSMTARTSNETSPYDPMRMDAGSTEAFIMYVRGANGVHTIRNATVGIVGCRVSFNTTHVVSGWSSILHMRTISQFLLAEGSSLVIRGNALEGAVGSNTVTTGSGSFLIGFVSIMGGLVFRISPSGTAYIVDNYMQIAPIYEPSLTLAERRNVSFTVRALVFFAYADLFASGGSAVMRFDYTACVMILRNHIRARDINIGGYGVFFVYFGSVQYDPLTYRNAVAYFGQGRVGGGVGERNEASYMSAIAANDTESRAVNSERLRTPTMVIEQNQFDFDDSFFGGSLWGSSGIVSGSFFFLTVMIRGVVATEATDPFMNRGVFITACNNYANAVLEDRSTALLSDRALMPGPQCNTRTMSLTVPPTATDSYTLALSKNTVSRSLFESASISTPISNSMSIGNGMTAGGEGGPTPSLSKGTETPRLTVSDALTAPTPTLRVTGTLGITATIGGTPSVPTGTRSISSSLLEGCPTVCHNISLEGVVVRKGSAAAGELERYFGYGGGNGSSNAYHGDFYNVHLTPCAFSLSSASSSLAGLAAGEEGRRGRAIAVIPHTIWGAADVASGDGPTDGGSSPSSSSSSRTAIARFSLRWRGTVGVTNIFSSPDNLNKTTSATDSNTNINANGFPNNNTINTNGIATRNTHGYSLEGFEHISVADGEEVIEDGGSSPPRLVSFPRRGVRLTYRLHFPTAMARFETVSISSALLFGCHESAPFPFTVLLLPPPPPVPVLSEALEAVSVATSIASMVLSGGAAAADMQTIALLGLSACSEGAARTSGIALRSISPASLDDSCGGAVSGSFLVVGAVLLLHFLVALVIYSIQSRSSSSRSGIGESDVLNGGGREDGSGDDSSDSLNFYLNSGDLGGRAAGDGTAAFSGREAASGPLSNAGKINFSSSTTPTSSPLIHHQASQQKTTAQQGGVGIIAHSSIVASSANDAVYPNRPLWAAMDAAKFPALSLIVITFLQKGFLLCGLEMIRGESGGGSGDEDDDGAVSNASSSAFMSLGLGYAGALWTIIPVVFYLFISFFVASRAFRPLLYPHMPRTSQWRLRYIAAALFLPSGELDSTVLGVEMFAPIIKAYRLPYRALALVNFASFFASVPLIAGMGNSCEGLYIASVVLYSLFALFFLIVRPHRIPATNILQCIAFALNAIVIGHYVPLLGDSAYETGGYEGNTDPNAALRASLEVFATLQTVLTMIRTAQRIMLTVCNLLSRHVAALVAYPISCVWEVVGWPYPSAARGLFVFGDVVSAAQLDELLTNLNDFDGNGDELGLIELGDGPYEVALPHATSNGAHSVSPA